MSVLRKLTVTFSLSSKPGLLTKTTQPRELLHNKRGRLIPNHLFQNVNNTLRLRLMRLKEKREGTRATSALNDNVGFEVRVFRKKEVRRSEI